MKVFVTNAQFARVQELYQRAEANYAMGFSQGREDICALLSLATLDNGGDFIPSAFMACATVDLEIVADKGEAK